MADFAAPSFSLGLDLDVDPDASTEEEGDGDQTAPLGGPGGKRSPLPEASTSGHRRRFKQEGEVDAERVYPVEAIEVAAPASTPAFKRLKRGPPPARPPETPSTPAAGPSVLGGAASFSALDDDIEEFSSQEDPAVGDDYSSRHVNTAFSSSKFSLHGQRILYTLSARKLKAPMVTPNSNVSISASVEAGSNKKVFPRLTTSPLKRIQSLDSDSDDLSIGEEGCEDVEGAGVCPKTNSFVSSQCLSKSQQKKQDRTSTQPQNENLWKDFSPKTNSTLATPALNGFCEEYFKSVKSPDAGQCSMHHPAVQSDFANGAELLPEDICVSNGYGAENDGNFPDLQPPSYQYLCHPDLRIQKLVRQRLQNFVPLGDVKGQFGQEKAACQVRGRSEKAQEGTSKSKPRNRKSAKGKDVEAASGTWVTHETCSAIPKDAGKRRVHADGRSFGRWLTGQDGKKVYVTKDGQELSGRVAYRHYMKVPFLWLAAFSISGRIPVPRAAPGPGCIEVEAVAQSHGAIPSLSTVEQDGKRCRVSVKKKSCRWTKEESNEMISFFPSLSFTIPVVPTLISVDARSHLSVFMVSRVWH
ncbi:hypothetical protein Taro_029954 [Colocasia esculenta]|uniref:Uncharacterized protein n=1 Tax=Colocasia esculenta TaxID=4460 RepID=A0A843VF34_COLES|nr:hypothetical protein [Colocasia esculenta]